MILPIKLLFRECLFRAWFEKTYVLGCSVINSSLTDKWFNDVMFNSIFDELTDKSS